MKSNAKAGSPLADWRPCSAEGILESPPCPQRRRGLPRWCPPPPQPDPLTPGPSCTRVFISCMDDFGTHFPHLSLEKSHRFCDLPAAPGSWRFREVAAAGGALGQVLFPLGNELWEGDRSPCSGVWGLVTPETPRGQYIPWIFIWLSECLISTCTKCGKQGKHEQSYAVGPGLLGALLRPAWCPRN